MLNIHGNIFDLRCDKNINSLLATQVHISVFIKSIQQIIIQVILTREAAMNVTLTNVTITRHNLIYHVKINIRV